MFTPVTIEEVRQVFAEVEDIERPDADNEGEPLNSPSVYNYLSEGDKEKVDRAFEAAYEYVRDSAGEPNNRAITQLNKNNFEAHFNKSQYDEYRHVGTIKIGDWKLDISDPYSGEED